MGTPSRRHRLATRTGRWVGALAVLGCVLIASLVTSGCAGPTWTAQVVSTDSRGLCARKLGSDEVQCWMYTPEFPSETRYRTGECISLTQAYRYSGPPHTRRVACPADATTSTTSTSAAVQQAPTGP